METIRHGLLWGTTFTVLGAVLGCGFMCLAAWVIPRVIGRLTPEIDEEKEILRGNMAVAEYFGRVVSSAILGLSVIIAAAVIAGIHG